MLCVGVYCQLHLMRLTWSLRGSIEVARGKKMSILPSSQLKKKSRGSQLAVEAQKRSSGVDRRKTQGIGEF